MSNIKNTTDETLSQARAASDPAQTFWTGGWDSTFRVLWLLFEEKATKRVKLGLIVGEIIKQNKITSDSEKVRARLDELASVYEQPEEVVNYYLSDEQRLSEIEQLVLEDTVIELVQASAKVTEKSISFDELMNPKSDASNTPAEKEESSDSE